MCDGGSVDCQETYDALYPTFQQGHVNVVNTGHWHAYQVAEFGDIAQIAGGTASGGGPDIVYSLFDIDGNTMRIETKLGSGEPIDVVEVEH